MIYIMMLLQVNSRVNLILYFKGVSVGALNSIAFAVYEKGDEAQAIQFLGSVFFDYLHQLYYLEDLWTDISADNIYRAWPGFLGVLQGFYSEPSLFDTKPLLELIEKKKTENNFKIKRAAIVSAVNADTGIRIQTYCYLILGSFVPFSNESLTLNEFL